MERMLVVVFHDESKAYEGSHALRQLDSDGSIAIHAETVIKKNSDGTVTLKESYDDLPVRVAGGTAIGSLIGLLEGPIGAGVGAAVGALTGSIADLNVVGVDSEFIDDVAASLALGKCAVIAEVSEEWITPVDARMEDLGGAVFRTARRTVEDDQRAIDVATLRAEIDQLKAEHARAQADRRAKLKAKIDTLDAKLQAKLDQAMQRSKQIESETEAKVQALERKAEKAQGAIKATVDARLNRIRQEQLQFEAKLKHLLAG